MIQAKTFPHPYQNLFVLLMYHTLRVELSAHHTFPQNRVNRDRWFVCICFLSTPLHTASQFLNRFSSSSCFFMLLQFFSLSYRPPLLWTVRPRYEPVVTLRSAVCLHKIRLLSLDDALWPLLLHTLAYTGPRSYRVAPKGSLHRYGYGGRRKKKDAPLETTHGENVSVKSGWRGLSARNGTNVLLPFGAIQLPSSLLQRDSNCTRHGERYAACLIVVRSGEKCRRS